MRGFPGLQAAFVERGKDVEREAEQLQRDEDDQEVLRCYEKHHSGGCKKDEQDELADVLGEGRVDSDQQYKDGESEQRNLDKISERIRDEHAVENVRLHRREQNPDDCGGAAEGREAGSDGEAEAGCLFSQNEQINSHHDECRGHDDDLRQCELEQLRVVDGFIASSLCAGPQRAANSRLER